MKSLVFIIILSFFIPSIYAEQEIKTINFLDSIAAEYNSAGPLMVRYDRDRSRVILINTNTSSVSFINSRNDNVTNIPIDGRVPQYLKEESFAVNKKNGDIYLIGSKNLTIVFPEKKTSTTFNTKQQYEMVAIDEETGNCFLAGRESKHVAFIDLKRKRIKFLKVFKRTEKMMNLNQTPPPPIRKIVADSELKKIFIFDGYTLKLYSLDISSGKVTAKRALNIKEGKRFHFAGYDKTAHNLYLVTETEKRKVVQALKIGCNNQGDSHVDLPGLSEGVGITLNIKRGEVYIPYDNHPVVHIVNFREKGSFVKVDIPSYGNDASAFDNKKNLLFIASWAFGEVYVIDLLKQKLKKRVKGVGIIPHMFSIAYDQENRKLFIPLGASAVNGSFGSAVTYINTDTWERKKVVTGWAPVELIEMNIKNSFLVFNTESQFAEVSSEGNVKYHELPYPYPVSATMSDKGNVFLSYGPHQSYWPAVYIWGAKNGIFEIEKNSLQIFDRRIPRLAHKIVFDKRGGLYGLQNSWGKENLFLTYFPEGIRMFAPQKRVYFYTKIQRENIQRILKYDTKAEYLYIVKVAETDPGPGSLLIVNPKDNRLIREVVTGNTPTDLCYDEKNIYISNFDSGSVTKIDKKNFGTESIKAGKHPLKILKFKEDLFIMNHTGRTIQVVGEKSGLINIPDGLLPDNMVKLGDLIYVSAHSSDTFSLFKIDPADRTITSLLKFSYPYGETTFDNSNTAFYLRGQFGDSIYEISKIKQSKNGKLWVTDLLSGRLFIISIQ